MAETDAEKQQAQDKKAQALQRQYNSYQELMTELQSQLSTFVSQLKEHQVVSNTLVSVPPEKRTDRKCFKMIGGVLVDKSVDEVIKILDDESKELESQMSKIDAAVTKTRKEMESWMKNNNVKIVKKPTS